MNEGIKKDPAITETDTEVKTNETDTPISNDNVSLSQVVEKDNEDDDYITYDKVIPKEIDWLWKPFLVKGNINILVGNGSIGKSFLVAWLSSAISKGEKIPFSEEYFKVGNCLIQDAEGNSETVNIHRLMANGAILERIGYIDEDKKSFQIKQLERLEKQIIKNKPQLVVLDPIQAYIGNVSINAMGEVREALMPLKKLAEKHNVAIVLIMHLNKNAGVGKAIYRISGSSDFVNIARSVILIAEDPENSSQRLFIPTKNNLMKESEKHSLCYVINDTGAIEWIEDKGYIDPDSILNQNENFDVKNSITKGFILGVLSKGDILGNDLKDLVINKGNISEKTFNIVKAQLRKDGIIDSYQKNKKFYWTLKTNEKERND